VICPACKGSGVVPDPVVSNAKHLIEDFGAKGDGVTDDTAVIQRALDSLKSGQTLIVPAGKIFAHSKVIVVRTSGITISGGGTLLATNEATSCFRIAADGVTVVAITFAISKTTKRWSTPDQSKVHLSRCSWTHLVSVKVIGSAASGIFIQGATDYELTDVEVRDTRADGIHQTGGACRGKILRPVVTGSGDDGIAVVSYLSDMLVCYDITVLEPRVLDQRGGRGLAVVGGANISFTGVYVSRSFGAGVYIASEAGWKTAGCRRVSVIGGALMESNQSTIDHGAVMVYADAIGGCGNITISNLLITNTRAGASRQVSALRFGAGLMARLMFDHLVITGGGKTVFGGNTAPVAIRRTGCTQNGTPIPDVLGWT
jgi:hypothetical protein